MRVNPVRLQYRPALGCWGAIPLVAAALAGTIMSNAAADTLEGALALAYRNNPQINAQRAATRAVDENVPIALAGTRPKASATAGAGAQHLDIRSKTLATNALATGNLPVTAYGINVTQTLYDGMQTQNRTRQAESDVLAAREVLRITEQTVLLNGVIAYMNLLRDSTIMEIQRNSISVLDAIVGQIHERVIAGESTQTDVAQAQARLLGTRTAMLGVESNYIASKAAYRQVIGVEPGNLKAPKLVDGLSPPSLPAVLTRARNENPLVTAATYNVDSAVSQVKVAEGALRPTISVQGNAFKTVGVPSSLTTSEITSASILGQISVPIYQGGSEYATIRQNKEILGQRRLELDAARLQADYTATQSFAQLEAAKAQIQTSQSQVTAADTAFRGTQVEFRAGQRTTLDLLNTHQELVNARIALTIAHRDRATASYALLAATGRLSPRTLGLTIPPHDPAEHYRQVRDAWFGIAPPNGR
jgi:outer membrane protein